MKIVLNGADTDVADAVTVADLVREKGARAERGTAVALNGEVVPRGSWQNTSLGEGDHVELLVAIGGG